MAMKLDPPKSSAKDKAHSLVRGGIGTTPLVGSVAAELFNILVAPPLERRLDDWRESVGERLLELENAGFLKISDLQDNDDFVSIVAKASQYAVTTHNEEKREALRNAVINTALGVEPDEAMRQMFLRFVDELTGAHVQVLSLLQDAQGWYQRRNRQPPQYHIAGSLSQMISDAWPELKNQRDLLEQIHKDLTARGLTGSGSFYTTMSGHGVYQKRTTDFGDRFLRFITESAT